MPHTTMAGLTVLTGICARVLLRPLPPAVLLALGEQVFDWVPRLATFALTPQMMIVGLTAFTGICRRLSLDWELELPDVALLELVAGAQLLLWEPRLRTDALIPHTTTVGLTTLTGALISDAPCDVDPVQSVLLLEVLLAAPDEQPFC